MLTVPTEDGGTLYIQEAEIKAASVAAVWDERLRVLTCTIRWHDDGRPGSPQIDIVGNEAVVTVRPDEAPKSLLERASERDMALAGCPGDDEI